MFLVIMSFIEVFFIIILWLFCVIKLYKTVVNVNELATTVGYIN